MNEPKNAAILKVAPYSFMTVCARADDVSFSNLRVLTNVGFFHKRRFFLIFYDVSIARKSKVNSGFSRDSLSEFF